MNGLKYIRTRCNLSLSELARFIGVTRQALSSWENGRKEIPEQRKEQLACFFGIDKEYFGEISEKEKNTCLRKQCFDVILSILVDTFISKISLPMQPVPEIGSISGA